MILSTAVSPVRPADKKENGPVAELVENPLRTRMPGHCLSLHSE